MIRRLLALSVIAFVAAPPLWASAVPTSRAHHAATTVVSVRPVDGGGHLRAGYTVVAHHGHASCSAGSEATGGAYRCFAGNFVFDPCWVASNRHHVVCASQPWRHKVVKLHVTKGYDNTGRSSGSSRSRLPWGVETAGGAKCGFVEGAGGEVGHARINYGCSHAKYVLIGKVDRSGKVWTIRKAKPTHGGHYRKTGRVNLTTAWFGKPSRKG